MRIGIMGGSFDPIHRGHLEMARLAQAQAGLDRVLFIPAKLSPFKAIDHAPMLDRWAMTLLATAEEESWLSLRWELERPEPSYSIDTVLELEKISPACEKFWIVGADNLPALGQWHRAEELFSRCGILVAPRLDRMGQALKDSASACLSGARYQILEGPLVPLSSSDLRERLRKGEDVSQDLHPSTWSYIVRYGLYGREVGKLWIPSTLS